MVNSDTSKKFDSVQLYRIRKLLQDLSNKTGRGTELVTLYLPPKKPIHEAIAALREESGTASNIKSDTTRAHVQDALTKTMQRLRLYKSTPENGLIIFCGAIPGPGGPGNEIIELYEVLPSKPVTTYLYRCVAPDTGVLLANGRTRSIADLKDSWQEARVASYDVRGRKVGSSNIVAHLEAQSGDRKVWKLSAESGRSIVGTDDHPFYTPRGWKKLGELKKGDLICVKPLADLSGRLVSQANLPGDQVIVDESNLRNLDFPPANIDLSLRRLRARGLLPLAQSNPKLWVIVRLLGHLLSDGSLTHNVEMRNGKSYSHFTIDLCVESESDLEEIRRDISELGVNFPRGFSSTHTLNIDGRSYTTHTVHAKLRDTALIALLRAAGAPIGSKVKKCPQIPRWIMSSSLMVKRAFLETLMGGDGEIPRMIGSNPSSALRLVFHRDQEMKREGMRFAQDLERLFAEFRVTVRQINTFPGYLRRDGVTTLGVQLSFKLSEENVLKICHDIGYRYCKRKESRALLVGEYLRIKSSLREELRRKMNASQVMRNGGVSVARIANALGLATMTASQWANGKVANPIIREDRIASYEEWVKQSTQGLGENLVWEEISSLEPIQTKRVMDLEVESEDHSFFANGFLVHNCDDHFHLDPLRDMLKEENVVGVLALDATEAGFGIVAGDSWDVIDVTSSGVSGKTRKGGQSARRYERLREMELTDYYNRLADHAKKAFLEQYQVKGLILSGPGPTKDTFKKENYLDYRLQKAIIGVLDTGYAGREGVRETIEKSGDLLQNVRVVEESRLVQRFLREVNSDTGLAIYGVDDVIKALKRSAVDVVLISDDSDMLHLRATCAKCGDVREKFIKRQQYVAEKQSLLSTPCPKCGSTEVLIIEKDIVDYFADATLDSGARVEIISSKTEDGAMLKSFGAVTALLRYRV